jgi:hypothetical protein
MSTNALSENINLIIIGRRMEMLCTYPTKYVKTLKDSQEETKRKKFLKLIITFLPYIISNIYNFFY